MEENIKVKKAEERDFKRIAELYKQGFSEEPYNEPWTFEKALDKIKLFESYCDIYVALLEENVVGFIIVNSNQWFPGEVVFIEEIVVERDFRKNGVAKKFIRNIEEIYKEKGYKELILISNKKSKAYEIWKKLGFSENNENILINKKLVE